MKDKQDILLIITVFVALTAIIILAHTTGVKEATLKMEKQAIANGAATYTQEGEFKWIKK